MYTARPLSRSSLLPAILLLGVILIFSGCSSGVGAGGSEAQEGAGQQAEEQNDQAVVPGEEPLYTPSYQPTGQEIAVLKTSKGDIRLEFYPDVAPNHVAAFIELSSAGFYDGTKFHRVVPGFVVQGGDPQTRQFDGEQVAEMVQRQAARQVAPGEPILGTGGPDYRLAQEFNSRQHLEGTLAMARSQDPDSAGSQFYICLGPQPQLDGSYTVFGGVVDGMDVVKSITVGDEIESVTVENLAQ